MVIIFQLLNTIQTKTQRGKVDFQLDAINSFKVHISDATLPLFLTLGSSVICIRAISILGWYFEMLPVAAHFKSRG